MRPSRGDQVRLRTVDAFTEKPFAGNPAAVLVLDEAPADAWMAAVARETNLSDTGFVIREGAVTVLVGTLNRAAKPSEH